MILDKAVGLHVPQLYRASWVAALTDTGLEVIDLGGPDNPKGWDGELVADLERIDGLLLGSQGPYSDHEAKRQHVLGKTAVSLAEIANIYSKLILTNYDPLHTQEVARLPASIADTPAYVIFEHARKEKRLFVVDNPNEVSNILRDIA